MTLIHATYEPNINMGELKLYFDPMSQPSRAILLFLKVNNIRFVEKQISLRKGRPVSFDLLLTQACKCVCNIFVDAVKCHFILTLSDRWRHIYVA